MSETTAEAHADAIRTEYGRWVATEDISIKGVPSFHKGDAVPIEHVERGVVDKSQVAGANTKAAAAAAAPKES